MINLVYPTASMKFSTYDLRGSSIIVFGDVKLELRGIESCSSSFNSS